MPTTLPSGAKAGPPELPGLIAASIWITCEASVAAVWRGVAAPRQMRGSAAGAGRPREARRGRVTHQDPAGVVRGRVADATVLAVDA